MSEESVSPVAGSATAITAVGGSRPNPASDLDKVSTKLQNAEERFADLEKVRNHELDYTDLNYRSFDEAMEERQCLMSYQVELQRERNFFLAHQRAAGMLLTIILTHVLHDKPYHCVSHSSVENTSITRRLCYRSRMLLT